MRDTAQRTSRLFGIMAHPVAHSLSPVMHNAAFKALQMPHHYHAFDVKPDELPAAVSAMRVLGIKGVNVSIPHKEQVLKFIDQINEEARVIGAVNTIVQGEDGRLIGYNTDGAGYVRSLLSETEIDLRQTHALVIGAGGAAKGIGVYLLKSGCKQLTVMNRTASKGEQLVHQLQSYIEPYASETKVQAISWQDEVSGTHDPFNLIINTTSVGMWPNTEAAPVRLKDMEAHIIVSDIVYNPLQTTLLQDAEKAGATVHQGLGMFVHQGALAFEYFTGEKAPAELMRHVILDRLKTGT